MLYVTKLVKKSLKNICKNLQKSTKIFFAISSETFILEGIGNSHSLFTFDFVFI